MSQALDAVDADRALKARHRAMWAMGDYPAVANDIIPSLGPILAAACEIAPGDQVLDVGAGSGNAAIPAAEAGATVTASDLTPELLDIGRVHAEHRGLSVAWETGDAESLPYADAAFDVVMSCVGVMFAPHHEVAADELVRVLRPGGRLGLLSWTPGGFIGEMFATMKPYAPPPPAGAQPPPRWGDEGHVRGLLGDRVRDVRATVQSLRVEAFDSGEAFRDYFKRTYGPTIAVYRSLAEDPERSAALDGELAALGDRALASGDGAMAWEYLLLTARRT